MGTPTFFQEDPTGDKVRAAKERLDAIDTELKHPSPDGRNSTTFGLTSCPKAEGKIRMFITKTLVAIIVFQRLQGIT